MSTAVMSTPMFDCGELLFKNAGAPKPKDPSGHAPLRRSYTSIVTLMEQHRKLDRSVSEPTSRYKTELCRPFEESGACKYGDKCQFAHGYAELRNLARHPKYKTELCRTFHTIGFCPYGPRCHFIHNFEEARIHNQKVSAQLGSTQPNIMGLSSILNSSSNASLTSAGPCTSSINVNVNLLEQMVQQSQATIMRTNSLTQAGSASGSVYNTPLMRTTSLSMQATSSNSNNSSHCHQTTSVIGTKPKPLNLSPTFSSLGSTADSVSPSSSLSQSPTNSMASFFSDDANVPTTPFSFGQDFGLLTRQSPSPRGTSPQGASPQGVSPISEDLAPRTPSPLSPNAESRLPVFNRISSTITDFDNLKL